MGNLDYINNAFTPDELKHGCFRNWDGVCNILTYSFITHMSKYLKFDNIKVILDIGSRDACQTLEFNRWFPNTKIYAFEPVPSNIAWCRNTTKNIPNITIIPKAVSSFNGKSKFYEVINGNVGASSFLLTSGHPRSSGWAQKEIEIECVRLEDWLKENNINKVDLIWADVQGVEKLVFEGMGHFLNDVDGIATEVELQALYKNATMKSELDILLNKNFHLLESKPEPQQTEADVIYVNKKYL
jgi:FkbM family methyltransferase